VGVGVELAGEVKVNSINVEEARAEAEVISLAITFKSFRVARKAKLVTSHMLKLVLELRITAVGAEAALVEEDSSHDKTVARQIPSLKKTSSGKSFKIL